MDVFGSAVKIIGFVADRAHAETGQIMVQMNTWVLLGGDHDHDGRNPDSRAFRGSFDVYRHGNADPHARRGLIPGGPACPKNNPNTSLDKVKTMLLQIKPSNGKEQSPLYSKHMGFGAGDHGHEGGRADHPSRLSCV